MDDPKGIGDSDNAIMDIRLSDGGYVAVSHPVCWSTDTCLARMAPEEEAEIAPGSLRSGRQPRAIDE